MSTELEILNRNKPLDYELCKLLGESPADFINLVANGEEVKFMGTPFDSPAAREHWRKNVDSLNDRSDDSAWPHVFESWNREFRKHYDLSVDVTAKDFHPHFTMQISRVCVGYSEHVHAAIGLFEKLGHRVSCWHVGKDPDGCFYAEASSTSRGSRYVETGDNLAEVISLAVKQLLTAEAGAAGLVS